MYRVMYLRRDIAPTVVYPCKQATSYKLDGLSVHLKTPNISSVYCVLLIVVIANPAVHLSQFTSAPQ